MIQRFCALGLLGLLLPAFALAQTANCNGTGVGLTPLTQLDAGSYQGFQGGLYAAGSNHRPVAHNAAGVAIANAIAPLDTFGVVNGSSGRVVVVSIGMSNCTQEFSTLVPKANADAMKGARVRLIDCAQGGQTASLIKNPNSSYWSYVYGRLRTMGASPLQPQVVWLKEANAGPSGGFPAATNVLLADLGGVVRVIHQKLPSVRLCYITSRIYAGYASTSLNPEPYAYESGFAVKWLIDAQVTGADSLNFDPAAGAVEAPWLAWGPYLWADGLTPRADGLTWACSEFSATDGTHPSTSGRDKVADSLLVFFQTDETTRPWYTREVAGAPASGTGTSMDLRVAPNPARGPVELAFTPRVGESWRVEVIDVAGRCVRTLARGVGDGARRSVEWDARDDDGSRVRTGLYWARLSGATATQSRCIALLASD
jgi:hypothetical protein